MASNTRLLMSSILANAVFSGVSALVLISAAPWIAIQTGLEHPYPVYLVGGGLALFSIYLGRLVHTRRVVTWEIFAIIGADLAWVAASFALTVLYFDTLTTIGVVLVIGAAIAVLLFAELQTWGWVRFRRRGAIAS